MKIYLEATTLAAGDREAASGFVIQQQRAVQSVDYVRGTHGAQFARGNWRHVVRFAVHRVHASLQAAQEFILDHADELPSSGLLHIETNTGTGDRWASDAVLAEVVPEIVGTSTRHTYTILCGEILDADPTPP